MNKYDHNAIILIAGKAGAGKSTTGSIIPKLLGCHTLYSPFAAPIKQMAANVLGVSVEKFNDYDFKNTHRPLLIALADSYKAVYGEDIFARKNVQTILDSGIKGVAIADDIRYPYEFEAMKATFKTVVLLEIVAPERAQTDIEHHSESTDWSFASPYQVSNDSDIETLTEKLKELLRILNFPVLADEFIQGQ